MISFSILIPVSQIMQVIQKEPEQSQIELTEQDTAEDTKIDIDIDVTEKKADTEAES